jgi:hypothetical protein
MTEEERAQLKQTYDCPNIWVCACASTAKEIIQFSRGCGIIALLATQSLVDELKKALKGTSKQIVVPAYTTEGDEQTFIGFDRITED